MGKHPSSGLFGTQARTMTLLAIAMLGETHGGELARMLNRSPGRIKEAVDSLELDGVIISNLEGNIRRLSLNPRYVAAEEIEALLMKLGSVDFPLQERLSTVRRRPRRVGKPL